MIARLNLLLLLAFAFGVRGEDADRFRPYMHFRNGDIGPVVPPPSAPVTKRGAKKLPQA